ncbi:TonB-dependent receptor [Pseudoalteromonas sp. C2R02]|uniref:TonB-dependent receptor plug domain-containing protein n=1 Tax=Pseudoalteromonas sp. C2R02 TaxID=2841565 RepID=UPI001C08DE49|nr:TonB-dependent receptor [Pseudoalteromonas sp. C2R02]MBU2967786.1 TonB-dependent receptor [Pseudoalteromonas sp. C2R02]
MYKRTIINLAILSTISTLSAYANSAEENSEEIEKIQITGSRIQRTDLEGAKPITIITKSDIVATGLTDVASVLAESIFNSAGTSQPRANTSAGNFSSSDLRGIGSNRTLTLVNGRRIAPSSSLYGSSANLNLIPIEVVERIEVLRDGASAIYGSDAMGGVINIITKKNYEGIGISLNTSTTTRGGAERQGGALSYGTSNDKSSLVVVLEHQTNSSLKGGERPHLDADYNDRRLSKTYSPWGSYYVRDEDKNYVYSPGPDCPEENIIERTSDIGSTCGYDVKEGKYYLPTVDKTSIFTNFTSAITDDIEFYNTILYTKDKTFSSSTPMWIKGWLDAGHVNNPTTGTDTEQDVRYYHYMEGSTPREFTFATQLLDINAGINWDFDDGSLSINLAHSSDSFEQKSKYYYFKDALLEAIEEGDYNPLAYAGGPNATTDVLDTFRHTSTRNGRSTTKSISIDWSSVLPFELEGGSIGYAIGGEFRSLNLRDEQDAQTNSGNVYPAYGGDTVGSRNYRSAYAEVELPVLDTLTISAATRYDSYSLPDQGQFSSSISARYEITDELVLRSSFSQGFRVADLNEATGEESVSFTSLVDPKYCNPVPADEKDDSELCDSNETEVRSFANKNLAPEESEQVSLGFAYDISKDFGITLDYWQIEISNQISSISGKTILDEEYLGNLNNYTGIYVTRDEALGREDEIVEIGSTTTNYLGLDTSGLDFSANAKFDLEDMGSIGFDLSASKVLAYKFQKTSLDPQYDYVGYASRPEHRASFTTNYQYEGLETFAKLRFIDSFRGESPSQEADGLDYQDFGSMTTVDMGIGYSFEDYGRIKFVAKNVFDKLPDINTDWSSLGYNYKVHSIIGRTLQLNYSFSL